VGVGVDRWAEERYRAFVRDSVDGVFCLAFEPPMPIGLAPQAQADWTVRHARLVECNRTFARWHGAEPDQLIGRRYGELRADSPDLRRTAMGKIMAAGYKLERAELELSMPDGSHRFFLTSGFGVIEDEHLVRIWGSQVDVTERRRVEIGHAAVGSALQALARLPAIADGDLPATYRAITEQGARTLGIARCSIWLFNAARTAIHCVDLYERDAERHSDGEVLTASDHPAYFAALAGSRVLVAANAQADPRTADFAAAYLDPHGITSMLDAPISHRGAMVGIVCNEHVGPAREFDEPAQAFAASLADFVAQAMTAAERRSAEFELRRSYEHLALISHRLEIAKEEERQRISRELHDQLGQQLTSVKIAVQMLGWDGAPAGRVAEAVRLVDAAIAEVRRLSLALSPALLDELGLAAALRAHLDEQAKVSGMPIELVVTGREVKLPRDLAITGFRAVQETVTNALRHAEASAIDVELAFAGDGFQVRIRDDGRGFDTDAGDSAARAGHLGLAGMRERVRMLGGDTIIRSERGGGTEVIVDLPLKEPR
jgi:signal transduction histidine kinase